MLRILIIMFLITANAWAAADAGPFHPLDALTPDEIALTVKLLKAAGDANDETVYPAITLAAASKDSIRAWKEGDAFTRTAFVVLRRNLVTYEAIVDLSHSKVVSNTPKPGEQPMILDMEWAKAREAFEADPRLKAAIAKRGLNNVICTPNSAGTFPGDGYEGKRILKVPCFSKDDKVAPGMARPIEGLMGIVDSDTGAVLDVIDNGQVPLPKMADGYGERLPTPAPQTHPITMVAPEGPNIELSGNLNIKWANWSMHARADKRAGVVLNLVRFNDGKKLRDIAYQMNIAEMFVPYMDPDPTWNYRTFMDAGEFGLGYLISSLKPGVDCPINAIMVDLTFPNDVGGTYTRPSALCLFERANGDPAWRHYSSGSRNVVGVAQTELVVRHIPTLGNYDYIVDYVFSPQGNITMRVGATGFDAIKSTTAKDMEDPAAAEASRYGALIAPYTIAPNHDHYFSFRLDLDVDGTQNALVRDTIVPNKISDSKTRTSLWTMKTDRYAAEGPISPDHMSAGESWRVINPNEKTGLKYNPSYWLETHHQATSVLDQADPPQRRAGFTAYSLWASRYAEGEDWAAGLYPNLSTKDEGLPAFVAQKRSINNEDLVIWYTMGFRHAPRPEDFPLLPTFWHEMTLRPAFFFDRDPSMTFNPGQLQPQGKTP